MDEISDVAGQVARHVAGHSADISLNMGLDMWSLQCPVPSHLQSMELAVAKHPLVAALVDEARPQAEMCPRRPDGWNLLPQNKNN